MDLKTPSSRIGDRFNCIPIGSNMITDFNLESRTVILNPELQSEKKKCFFTSEDTSPLPLTDQLHGSNYRNDEEYQSDGNCLHIQRKRFFFSQYLWE